MARGVRAQEGTSQWWGIVRLPDHSPVHGGIKHGSVRLSLAFAPRLLSRMTGTPVWSIRLLATRAAAARTVARYQEQVFGSLRMVTWSFSWMARGDMSTPR